ncbi:MAG: nitrite reductase [Thermoanaerobacteraceae bacterium]|nr:nitrite reductase [Thermoanaerobacteraceae bacterium]
MDEKISAEEKAKLKDQGFIPQRDGKHYSCRVITENGCLNSEKNQKLSDIAEKYGRGYMCYTVRLTIEIPWIKYEDIEKVKAELKEVGLYTGGTGARVRPVVACKGTYCGFGFLDTQLIAKEIHERFYKKYYDVKLPHKFKIAVGGCPNNCIKPDLNDIGIMGQKVPLLDESLCLGCKKCGVEAACRVNAAKVIDGKLKIDREKCNNCGFCIDKCHFEAMKCEKEGVKIFIGGKWGKAVRRGNVLPGIYSIEEAMDIIEKAILYYKENGNTKERFGDMIDRIGFEEVSYQILNKVEIYKENN